MKKLLAILLAAGLLAACGNKESNMGSSEPQKEKESDFTYIPEETPGTDDPVEFGDKTNKEDLYVEGAHEIKIVGRYLNADTDDKGFNHVEFEGYTYNFAMLAAEDNYGDEMIVLAGETENGTEDTVAFNSDLEVLTSNQEQAENQEAVGTSKSGIKQKAFVTVPLEYGLPDDFTVTIQPPMKEVGEDEYEDGHYGEPAVLEFVKE